MITHKKNTMFTSTENNIDSEKMHKNSSNNSQKLVLQNPI